MLDKFVIVIRKVSGAIKITVLLVIVRILLGEVIKLLLSLFYGQYGGSFLLPAEKRSHLPGHARSVRARSVQIQRG